MTALLDAIDRAVSPRRTRRVAAISAAVALGAVALVAAIGLRGPSRPAEMCLHAEDRLAGVWDAAERQRLSAAFAATKAPFAEEAAARTGALFDRYAAGWAAMHREACEATHVRGEQSSELLDLRMTCLARRREGLRALKSLLVEGGADAVQRGVQAAAELPPLDECASVEALTAPLRPPADPAARARIETARIQVDEAAAQSAAGRFERSAEIARAAVVQAESLGYRPLEAEASLALGLARMRSEDADGAENALRKALLAASASDHRVVAARALLSLARVHGLMRRHHEEGRLCVDLAAAMLERVGDAPLLSAERLIVTGNLLLDEGRAGEAVPLLEQGLSLQERAAGADDPRVAATLGRLATALANAERYPEALDRARRALDLLLHLYGPDHVEIATALGAQAFILAHAGKSAEAVPLLERALRIEERAFGPDHPALVKTLIKLSNVQTAEGAIPLLERARAIQERAGRIEHPDMVFLLKNLAISHAILHHTRESLALAERALPIEQRLLGAEHPDVAETHHLLGQARLLLGERDKALPLLEKALSIAEARPITDAAAAGREARIGIRGDLADALWLSPKDRPRARAVLQGALDLARGSPATASFVPPLEAWLSSHR